MTRQELILMIKKAWEAAPIPKEDEIAKHNTSYEHCEETYVRKFFTGKTWDSINYVDLAREYPGPPDACLSFMSPQGLHYFLPTFMLFNLLEGENADTSAYSAECAIYEIAREKTSDHFSNEQRAAIKSYLEFIKGTELSYFKTNGK